MKKTRLIAALLAASFIIGCTPVQAEGPRGRLRKVKKQLDESLNRFKRCMRGKCTRKEKIKVARDVGIAAAGAVLAIATAAHFVKKARMVPYGIIPGQRFDSNAVMKVFPPGSRVRAYTNPDDASTQVSGEVVGPMLKRDTREVWLGIKKDDGTLTTVRAVWAERIDD